MDVSIKRSGDNPDLFEFSITTQMLRSQFVLPRELVNKLRIAIEQALVAK